MISRLFHTCQYIHCLNLPSACEANAQPTAARKRSTFRVVYREKISDKFLCIFQPTATIWIQTSIDTDRYIHTNISPLTILIFLTTFAALSLNTLQMNTVQNDDMNTLDYYNAFNFIVFPVFLSIFKSFSLFFYLSRSFSEVFNSGR